MKLDKSIFSITILSLLILLVVSMVLLGFFKKSEDTEELEIPSDFYRCADTLVPFRANITDCNAFPIKPDEEAFKQLVLNPLLNVVFLTMDKENSPSSNDLLVSMLELDKTFKSLLIPDLITFTESQENHTDIFVISIENATQSTPVIWFRDNQSKNSIEVSNNSVIVYGKTYYDIDAAACKMAIIAINDKFDCSYEKP